MLNKNNLIAGAAILVTVGCLARFVYFQFDRRPKINVQPFAELGSFVAEETSKLLPARARVVVLVVDTAHYQVPTLDTLLSAFSKGLKRKRDITIAGIEKFRVPPSTFMALSSGSLVLPNGEFSPTRFADILRAHANVEGIVSFVGLPASLPTNSGEQQQHPRIIVVSNRNPELVSVLQSGGIDLAIVPQAAPSAEITAKSSNRPRGLPYETLAGKEAMQKSGEP